MNKLVMGIGAVSALAMGAPAYGLGFDSSGVQSDPAKPKPPIVAPRSQCLNLRLFAADADPATDGVKRYRMTGDCSINIEPVGKTPVMKDVMVLLDAEYAPKLHRASEKIVVHDPDLGVTFETWATCPSDPFVGKDVKCTAPGMGTHKFQAFLSLKDIPFAQNRIDPSYAKSYTQKFAGKTAGFFDTVKIKDIQVGGLMPLGQMNSWIVDVGGGLGMCWLKMSFDDGTPWVMSKLEEENPNAHMFNHVFLKPGLHRMHAVALPGCSGEAYGEVIVKTPFVNRVEQQLPKVGPNAETHIAILGADGLCKVFVDFGDGSTETTQGMFEIGKGFVVKHRYLHGGPKKVTVKGLDTCKGDISGTVDVNP